MDDESLILIPAIGLHSPGEHVSVNFGGRVNDLLNASPPKQLQPFAFDVNAYLLQLSEEEAQREGRAGDTKRRERGTTATATTHRSSARREAAEPGGERPAQHITVGIARCRPDRDEGHGRGECEPMSDDDRDEMLRYATSRSPWPGIRCIPPGARRASMSWSGRSCVTWAWRCCRGTRRMSFSSSWRGRGGGGRGRGGGGGAGGRGGEGARRGVAMIAMSRRRRMEVGCDGLQLENPAT